MSNKIGSAGRESFNQTRRGKPNNLSRGARRKYKSHRRVHGVGKKALPGGSGEGTTWIRPAIIRTGRFLRRGAGNGRRWCRADDFAGASRNLKFMWSLMFLLSCHFDALGSEHGTHRSESVRRPELHTRNRRPACIWCSLERLRTVRWPPSEQGHDPRDDGKPFQPFSQHVVSRRRHESLHMVGAHAPGQRGSPALLGL